MSIAYLGIGSNIGDRKENIRKAVKEINALKGASVLKVSRLIETEPVGCPSGSKRFLNGTLKIDTSLTPIALLKELKGIEKRLGRKKSVRFGPREIDIDILLFNNKIIKNKILAVPHPRMWERQFVLRPLKEVI